MTRILATSCHIALASALAAVAMPAAAQERTDSEGVEDIVVTAERREANLQDVPISVTAFSEEGLEQRGVQRVGDVIDFAPNVSRTTGPNGGDDGGFFIRGIGQLDNSIAVDPGVGVYIDEIYIARTQSSSFDVFDVSRVEVLRGPQGTLFGRNTIGGAISVITQNPEDEFGGRVQLTTGSRNRFDVSGMISAPLSDYAGIRISAFTRNQDGLGRNLDRDIRFGNIDTAGGRITFNAELPAGLDVRMSADYARGRGTPAHQILLGFNPASGITVPRPAFLGGPFFRPGVSPTGVPFPAGVGNDRSTDRFINFTSAPARASFDNWGFVVRVSGDIADGITLRSITGYREYDEDQANDFDGTGFGMYDTTNRIGQRQLSQELQLVGEALDGRLRFLLGGYYFYEKISNQIRLCTGSNRARLVPGCLASDNDINLTVESVAGFGNIGFNITDTIEVTAGARITRETKTQTYVSILDNRDGLQSVLPPIAMPPPGTTRTVLPFTRVSDTFDAFTPRLGINWSPDRDILLYASWSRGFKSGGFTGRPSNQQILPYDPETVETFEIGAKTELLDRRLRINLAAFTSDYQALQLLVFVPATGLFETANAGDARIRGVEAEVQARFGDLTLGGAVGYLDAQYTRVSPLVLGVTLDDRLPLTSDWTWSVSAQYDIPVGTGELQLRADYNYRSTFSFQIENDPLEIEPGYGLLGARVTYVFPNERLRLAVFGSNLTGERFFTNRQDSRSGNGIAFGGPGAPAEWGAELTLRF